jgi:hypothetical protein
MANSAIKKVVAAFTGSESLLGSEMPETPGLKLPQGKISSATRRKIVANRAGAAEEQ